ncbi:MAG TPA: hypothetical protein VFD66_11275 [Verrucomicrobiae bacterium]|nr:hypothetical protein [Verrucomicrobiae bacterium]
MSYKTYRLVASNPASGLEKVHRQLGPSAVVLSMRQLPGQGLARLWHKSIEIVAGLPNGAHFSEAAPKSFPGIPSSGRLMRPEPLPRWPTVAWLETMGLLTAHAEAVQAQLNSLYPISPASRDAEWQSVRAALAAVWSAKNRSANASSKNPTDAQTHVFIGPPGSGKTTVLCKWLTMAVLTEERAARVSRLDGAGSNNAEFLSVHCEMLGVALDRSAHEASPNSGLHFIDLPGIAPGDDRALAGLREQLSGLHAPAVHLVLNAAYETEMLLAQSSAFAPFGPVDLILTHLDEEMRRVKLWNLVFGTNFTIRFVSAGQKIPGEFRSPVPDDFFPCEINQ